MVEAPFFIPKLGKQPGETKKPFRDNHLSSGCLRNSHLAGLATREHSDIMSTCLPRPGHQAGAATRWAIAPNRLCPSPPFISMRIVSPYFMNSVFGAPDSIVSIARFSAMHE